MDSITSFLSFIGAGTIAAFILVGASVILRGAWAAAAFTWGRRDTIDAVVEDELKIKIGR